MEISCSQYLSQAKLMSCSSSTTPSSVSPSINFYSKASLLVYNSVAFHSSKSIVTQLKGLRIDAKRPRPKNLGAIHASEADQSTTTDVAERWLLEPVGDGDSRHIGFKVPMPNAFEIASSEVTVGRLAEKADMVIPVATVSGIHARIQKKGDSLLVTDLDSTNGTFIDDKRVRPGVVASASPGSCITFVQIVWGILEALKLFQIQAIVRGNGRIP
ncbi:Zeaxanthin epoxidase, chloroplastic [Melia azedarach]|uniref:Zeaxanthin epoxidase, chloroplastic n=1 Tax=Melia azedarach TaxID=155640 RepID=A0ACC1YNK0_MELAZ|nr:Zeaxanthin epoxidase, chloroplastic [Melia azedarach]